MAHGKRLIPDGDAEYEIFFKNICQYTVKQTSPPDAPRWSHIPAAEVTALLDAYAMWHTAYTATLKPHTPAETAEKNHAHKESRKVLSRFIRVWFRGFPDQVTAADLRNMNIFEIDNNPSPVPRPQDQPEADVTYPGRHLIELVHIRPVAGGTDDPRSDWGTRIFLGILDESGGGGKYRISKPPLIGDDLPHSVFIRRKHYRFNFEGFSGKAVYFCLRYENEKGGEEGKGPFGPILHAVIP
jgi:hypothetical protein